MLPLITLLALQLISTRGIVMPERPPSPRILHADSSRPLQAPSFGSLGEERCSAAGHVFLDVDVPPSISGAILDISSDGSRSRTYAPLQMASADLQVKDFAVSPSATLYELFQSAQATLLVEVDSDGSAKHRINLEVPAHVEERWMVVFDDGVVLFSGFFTRSAAAELRGKSYAALFQSSGNLIRQLSGYPDVDIAALSKKPLDGWITIGQDGNAYILSADKITVLSESGQVQRRLSFTKPDPEAAATRVDYSDGLLAIYLTKSGADHQITMKYLVLYADTGEIFGYYQPLADLGPAMCFSRQDGFTFRRFEKGQSKIVNALLQ